MTKRYNIAFKSKVTPVKQLNDEFTLCKCYVMAIGKNRNLSHISKEAADKAMPTLYNIPVVGHLYEDEDGNRRMGGHDMEIKADENGGFYFKSLCVPYGVVPSQNEVRYEEVKEPSGETKQYLVSDIILWTGRYPELRDVVYDENILFGQSMEINVEEHERLKEDSNYIDILSYSYSALCLLGKSDDPNYHTEPCFPSARIEAYEFTPDEDKFTELWAQMKNELALCFENSLKKGGDSMEKNIENTNVTTETSIEETQNSSENFAAETVNVNAEAEQSENENNQEETFSENSATEDVVPDETTGSASFENVDEQPAENNGETATFSCLYSKRRAALENAVERAMPATREVVNAVSVSGEFYDLMDFDDTYAYIYCCKWGRDDNGLDTDDCFAVRRTYTYNEESDLAEFTSDPERVVAQYVTDEEIAAIEALRAQYAALVEYKENREREDFEASIDMAMRDFADLEGNEEFAKVVEKKYTYTSVDEFKNACYIIRGKFSSVAKPKQGAEPSIRVANTKNETSKYDAFFARYGKK